MWKGTMFFTVTPVLEGGGIADKSSASSSMAQPADVTFGYRWRSIDRNAAVLQLQVGG